MKTKVTFQILMKFFSAVSKTVKNIKVYDTIVAQSNNV